jgi:hypothetical protein
MPRIIGIALLHLLGIPVGLLLQATPTLAEDSNPLSDVINNCSQPQIEFKVMLGNEQQDVKANPRFFVRVKPNNPGVAETWCRNQKRRN